MPTFLLRYRRYSPPIRFISKALRPRIVNAALLQKRHRFLIRSRRRFHEVVYCSESPPSNGQILPEQSSHDEIIVDHNNHQPPEDFPDESPPPEPPQNPEITWGSLIPPRLKVFWTESGSAQILKECFGVLKRNLWTLMSLTALNSATRFLLVWTLYKTVCIFAVHLFGVPAASIPQEMIPTSSSLGDPDVYQQVADITFLVFKPFDFVLKGIFIAAGLMTCNDSIQGSKNPGDSKKQPGLIRSLWRSFKTSLIMLWKSLKLSKEYMIVYIIAGALTAFYQGLALLLVPLLYALRRLMNIQLALCATLFEGKKGKEALKHSTKMVEPIRRHLYFPYLLLLLAPKFLGVLRDMVVKLFPDRLFAGVPEITWGLIACTTVTAFLIDRMADILPIVVFNSPLPQSKTEKEAETN